MLLSSNLNRRPRRLAALAKFVMCLLLGQSAFATFPEAQCDSFLQSHPGFDAPIRALQDGLLDPKQGFAVIQRPPIISVDEIEQLYNVLPKGWSFNFENGQFQILPHVTTLKDAVPLSLYEQLQIIQQNFDPQIFVKIQELSTWMTEMARSALPDEKLEIESFDLRVSNENQVPAGYLKRAEVPHIDGGYLSAITILKGDATYYWDRHRKRLQIAPNEVLFMTNKERMNTTKIRPTLHQAPIGEPQPRLILIVRFKRAAGVEAAQNKKGLESTSPPQGSTTKSRLTS